MGRRWFRRRDGISSTLLRDDIRCDNVREFSYASLKIATNNFSKDRLIGEGGYARVFKGLLFDGTLIAVKKYHDAQFTGRIEGFLSSVEVMSYIRHRNVDNLIGYCVEDDCLLLVTEYAEFGSLRDVLVKKTAREEFGKWHTRAAICMGIARGLSYLHHDVHPFIIHRDIKLENILLDSNLTPRITDFDLVKLFYDPNESELTHHTNTIVGTYGYMAPEYVLNDQYSGKTDVFSFGVVILEIISGRSVHHDHFYKDEYKYNRPLGFITWASRLVRNDRVMEFIDPLLTDYPIDVVQRFINVAFLCVQRDPELRPNMQEVMHMLFGVCNSTTSCSLTTLDMSLLDLYDVYPSLDSSREGSITSSDIEDEGEILILEDEGIVTSTGNDSADVIVDSNTDVNLQGEIEGVETCTAEEQRKQRKTKKKTKPGIILSGSGDLVERLSQTTVFKKHAGNEFPEAVYPPYHTSVVRRVGSRNGRRLSQTMVLTKNVCPVSIYPPSHTRVYKRLGSGNERRLSQTRVFKTNVCPEAVYPPFHTRVNPRFGSRNLYASDF